MKQIFIIALILFIAKANVAQDMNADVALAKKYQSMAVGYRKAFSLDSALFYYQKAQTIYIKYYGNASVENAGCVRRIGIMYSYWDKYDLAINHIKAAIAIYTQLGDSFELAQCYRDISNIYSAIGEFDMSLDYGFKSLDIQIKQHGKKHEVVAMTYYTIGVSYFEKGDYKKALEYHLKCLEINLELFGETNVITAMSFLNIGNVYGAQKNYDKALEYFNKGLSIQLKLVGDKSFDVATTYNNIANAFLEKKEFEKALEYNTKSFNIKSIFFSEKNVEIARSYNIYGSIHNEMKQYEKALKYYQKGMTSCLYNFIDTINFYYIPPIANYLDWYMLLKALIAKAQIFANDTIQLNGFDEKNGMKTRYQIALKHHQACDTLINQVRKEITMLSDKIALGEKANQVYNEAVEVCLKLSKVAPNDSVDYYKKLAFEYSEKNKSSVLLESLAGAQAMQFSGIPDSLLEKEHNLQIDIALYKRLLSEQPDSVLTASFRDRLFKANRNYEELIQQFEKNYTQYYNLKYGQNLANVSQLQQTLDKTTAIISYQETDSVLFIFYIDKTNYQIYTTPKRSNYQEIINVFRQSLVNTAPNNSGLSKAAHFLYKQLFPFTIESHIQNLIIIPEGSMCLIPFEALLTEEYKGNPEQYCNYAYLVKEYNISYAYSASLFYRTFPKTPTKKVEVTQLNDWLAIAPVFDDVKTGGASFRTRQLLRDMERIKTDTITTRAFMLTGEYITPLPGTEQEVKNIFNKFENKNKKAAIQLHAYANEVFVKSEEIKNYKYLHFASHGIVNMQKPELSGIILAQDSSSNEDGILYSGEIYNLKLNADLTVLSACETGLGEIKKGEGLIGLTRALLYAGSKNIIVSLWKVADNSTSQLMVDFYDILLKDEKNTTNYSSALRQAKLKMISEGKYSHPFYWSPFVLIGK